MTQAGRLPRLQAITSNVMVSVTDLVARSLRETILKGGFRPGERLLQDDLAADLAVSRQPVREALHRLVSEGLILQSPQRGYVVREYTDEDINENYYLRTLLESEAARIAADKVTRAELEGLKVLNHNMASAANAGEASQVVEINANWHSKIHEIARMPTLARLIKQLWVGHTVFTPLFVQGRGKRSVKEHSAIIRALEERNPEGAAIAMREHIQSGARELFESMHTVTAQPRDRG